MFCNKKEHGVTLLELLVVIGIIAVLAGFAGVILPDYITKANRVYAVHAIQELEQLMSNVNRLVPANIPKSDKYGIAATTNATGSSNFTVDHGDKRLYQGELSWTIDATSTRLTNYTIKLTGLGRQANDKQCNTWEVSRNFEDASKSSRIISTKNGSDNTQECFKAR